MNFILSLLLVAQLGETKENLDKFYKEAQVESRKSGDRLIVLLVSEGCPPCVKVKSECLETLRGFQYFAVVRSDLQPALTKSLTDNGSVPQLIIFCYDRVEKKWGKSGYVGYDEIREYIDVTLLKKQRVRNTVKVVKQCFS